MSTNWERGIGRPVALALPLFIFASALSDRTFGGDRHGGRFVVDGGQVTFELAAGKVGPLGGTVSARGVATSPEHPSHITFEISPSTLEILSGEGEPIEFGTGEIRTSGALAIHTAGKTIIIGNLTLLHGDGGIWRVVDRIDGDEVGRVVFLVGSAYIEHRVAEGELRIAAELFLAEPLATALGAPREHSQVIGRVLVAARTTPLGEAAGAKKLREDVPRLGDPLVASTLTAGPDVIVGNLHDVNSHGSSGGISAYSVGTVSCNIGDEWLDWSANTNRHPVIAQNMYRMKDGRFEQIGMSWVKHGFFALSQTLCFGDCQRVEDGTHLGVHCSDPYTASQNGDQPRLGPRYQINAYTGNFPYPPANPSWSGPIARRIQVKSSDMDPSQNEGAQYYVEGHYVTRDDAEAGNQDNNVSYRTIDVSGSRIISLTGSTRREQPAIRAWAQSDAAVRETEVRVPNDGLFIIAAKPTDLGDGFWRYEYAVYNLNSNRAARTFSVPIDPTSDVRNIGFHDVHYHSGEPFSTLDWGPVVGNGAMTWTTQTFDVNPNANALRWGTLYNYRFENDRPPHTTQVTMGLFRPDTPEAVTFASPGPITSTVDCNNNGVPDGLDVENGDSVDCDGDKVPDECESFPPRAVLVSNELTRPVYATSPPGDDQRLFVVEQEGKIRILSGFELLETPFLDIASLVSSTGERGLLSLAFDPDYFANGAFYVNYTDLGGDTVIARYRVSADPNVADATTGLTLKTIQQDLATHNGGQLQFGPDGFLYVGMGDGGGQYDPFNRAQDTGSLLGKILRLDVDSPPNYIPKSNPFTGAGLPLPEIWTSGVRNPWRFSFDRLTGDLYVADVGADSFEEVTIQSAASPGGEDYGWRCMEGLSCTGLSGCVCNDEALTLPILDYPHDGADCAITGGYVYRGCALPNLLGFYLYADYCSGAIRSFRYVDGAITEELDLTATLTTDTGAINAIVSFAENGAGELFIISHNGSVYRIVPDPTGGAVCGNNVLEVGEFCDDGNTSPGDGCDENCATENGPVNNRCATALRVGEGSFDFDTTDSTMDGPDERALCRVEGQGGAADIWYCYTPSCSGTATAHLCGTRFDALLAVYDDGCDCPTQPSALACEDDECTGIDFSVTACETYLIRVAGYEGLQGAGTLTIDCDPGLIENDCDGNGIADGDDLLCGTLNDTNGNGIPDTCETSGDFIRGGRLYDRWWAETNDSPPSTDHPLWASRPDPLSNIRTAGETWRCKECHGWDYEGVDGQYGQGSHRTGFGGVLGTTLDAADIFALLKEPLGGGGVLLGHDYGSVLPDTRIDDLVAFVLAGAIDDGPYIDAFSGDFSGDPVVGEANFLAGIDPACITCHGADGTNINFGSVSDPEYLGTVAVYNPWEMLHKIRFGQPGAAMPSWVAAGGSTQGAADIGRHAQLDFPVDCILDTQCDDDVECTADYCSEQGRCVHDANDSFCLDDGVFCNGLEACLIGIGCTSPGNPCSETTACVELSQECGCESPVVDAAGSRYLAITPQPANAPAEGAAPIPVALLITPECAGGVARYVGEPFGEFNVAMLVDHPSQAAFLTPTQWGGTVYVTGIDIAPNVSYAVQEDCGIPKLPILTNAAVVTTPVWGDVIGREGAREPDGVANALDITAVVDGVKELPSALPLYKLDLLSCTPNQKVDVVDLTGVVDAVKDLSFRNGTRCPGPCW